ncbi:MAG TPA: nitroreductase family protein [Coriobacteriia bacterium]|nr:nitroreductase family protein [Coriobacteriia bacterium]
MDVFDALERRRSVRSFLPDPVPREALERIVSAAAMAPSAMNAQPWRFYVTTGETRTRIGEAMAHGTKHLEEFLDVMGSELHSYAVRWYSELGHAPVVIVCTMPYVDDEFSKLNTHLSVGAAIENMLLAATGLGLGACNITFSFYVRDELARVLDVPSDRVIAAVVAVGYPCEDQPPAPGHETDVAVFLG